MEIIKRRNNNPETRKLVEQKNALCRPCKLRPRYDHQSQRTTKTAINPELTRVRSSMQREDRGTRRIQAGIRKTVHPMGPCVRR